MVGMVYYSFGSSVATLTRHRISLAIWLVNNQAPYKEDIADNIYARQHTVCRNSKLNKVSYGAM